MRVTCYNKETSKWECIAGRAAGKCPFTGQFNYTVSECPAANGEMYAKRLERQMENRKKYFNK